MSTLPFACVETTKIILSRSGVNPGHGASEMVKIDPSMKFYISYDSCEGM